GMDPPKTPPPNLGEATFGDDERLKVQVDSFLPIPVTKEVEKVVNGVTVKEPVTVSGWFANQVQYELPPASYLVFTMGNDRLDDAAVKELFTEAKPLLVISHGKRIDPHYAAVFKPETPVLYIRPGTPFAPSGLTPEASVSRPAQSVFTFVSQVSPAPAPATAVQPQFGEQQPVVMSPRQVSGIVAQGKITLVDYAWGAVPLWKTKEVEKQLAGPTGDVETIKEQDSFAETIWVPKKQVTEFPLADCQVIGHDGKPVAGVDLAARLATGAAILWLQEGLDLDTRFCEFLKPDALIVRTPAPPFPAYEGSMSCAPHLDFHLAQVTGEQLTLTKQVFEEQVKRVPYTETVDNVVHTHYKEVRQIASRSIHTDAKLSDYRGYSRATNGHLLQKWPEENLRKHLAKQRPVFVCEYADGLIPQQLSMLKPDVLILAPIQHDICPYQAEGLHL
ncbi:MAG TPA: hypothetical protein VFQ26_02520, partial [Nitrospiraceae bacterium]|nr:hypothetical protein [Nitrospiraceae bacterium]